MLHWTGTLGQDLSKVDVGGRRQRRGSLARRLAYVHDLQHQGRRKEVGRLRRTKRHWVKRAQRLSKCLNRAVLVELLAGVLWKRLVRASNADGVREIAGVSVDKRRRAGGAFRRWLLVDEVEEAFVHDAFQQLPNGIRRQRGLQQSRAILRDALVDQRAVAVERELGHWQAALDL